MKECSTSFVIIKMQIKIIEILNQNSVFWQTWEAI